MRSGSGEELEILEREEVGAARWFDPFENGGASDDDVASGCDARWAEWDARKSWKKAGEVEGSIGVEGAVVGAGEGYGKESEWRSCEEKELLGDAGVMRG